MTLKGTKYSTLHLAAEDGRDEILKFLIDHQQQDTQQQLEGKNSNGCTLLHCAIIGNRLSTVKLLLDLGGDFEATNDQYSLKWSDWSALTLAMNDQREEIVKMLLERGCRVDRTGKMGHTLLHGAAMIGHEGIFKLLLDHGELDVNAQNSRQQSVLHVACEKGHDGIVKILIKLNVKLNEAGDHQGQTELHCAVYHRRESIVKLLLDYGVDVNATDNEGCTALHVACRQDDEEMIRILIGGGAKVNGWERPVWLEAIALDKTDMLLFIINDCGCDVESRTYRGETALHVASGAVDGSDRFNFVEALLQCNAEIEARYVNGRTPLMLACWFENKRTMQLLFDSGASVNVHDNDNKNIVELCRDREMTHRCYWEKRKWTPCARTLVCQIVKMKTQGLPVLKKIYDDIEMIEGEIRGFKDECEKTLERMRSSKPELWSLLTTNHRCLANFARNHEMVRFLESSEVFRGFCIYSNLLRYRMTLAIERRNLLDEVQYFFKAVAEYEGNEHLPKLPVVCVHEIFSYFFNGDFDSLIKVCNGYH